MNSDISLPDRMANLPRNKAGYVVPWFVGYVDGTPDFRVIRPDGITDALRFDLCWLCGQHRGRYGTFVIGPMCAVNRVSAEPPSHQECAEYAAKVCPFLTTPSMVRRDRHLPDHTQPAGEMIPRNPGVALCWTSRTWAPFRAPGGVLVDVGDPTEVTWWAHGRPATRDEVENSVNSGLPILEEMAQKDGARAVAELARMHGRARTLFPVAG